MVRFVNFDEKNKIFLTDDYTEFLHLTAADWITEARYSCNDKNSFFVALSGGRTPLEIFKNIVKEKEFLPPPEKIFLFWSDERNVPDDHSDSNYGNAMNELSNLNIPENNIFRMNMQDTPEQSAIAYNEIIKRKVPDRTFDLVMLGIGTDGHIASLFPGTKALEEREKDVVANFVPFLNTERITLTLPCITRARQVVIYVSGADKKDILKRLFEKTITEPENVVLPAKLLNHSHSPVKWFINKDAYDTNTLSIFE
ncbi:MAG: 6-phosphogluconolactonase [Victivallaceae bacterium]